MPRLESPFPPHHRRCLLGSTILDPSVVAGLLDGDGAVGLEHVGRTSGGVRLRPYVSLASPDDDPTPFAAWMAVRSATGRNLGSIYWDPRRRRNAWRVKRLREVIEFLEWLRDYPPLTPHLIRRTREVHDVALALLEGRGSRAATQLALRERSSGAGPQLRHDASPFPGYWSVSDRHLRGVIVGLIATDGYFAIKNARSRYAPVFSLPQRQEAAGLLEAIRSRMDLGEVEQVTVRSGSSGQIAWVVRRRADAGRLIEFLEEFPLPPTSPTAAQLRIWTRAWLAREERQATRLRESRPLAVLYAEIRQAKLHGPHAMLCSCH